MESTAEHDGTRAGKPIEEIARLAATYANKSPIWFSIVAIVFGVCATAIGVTLLLREKPITKEVLDGILLKYAQADQALTKEEFAEELRVRDERVNPATDIAVRLLSQKLEEVSRAVNRVETQASSDRIEYRESFTEIKRALEAQQQRIDRVLERLGPTNPGR